MPSVYKRILCKLSGEALKGPEPYGIHQPTLESIVHEVKEVYELGTQVALVVGGGNIFRGIEGS
ncbi:MAG TPA: UMP kinase, partial [Thermodesulfovibrionia bacterium]|nr:UMP kinase [Thermodesulfovibrionia bacterium]